MTSKLMIDRATYTIEIACKVTNVSFYAAGVYLPQRVCVGIEFIGHGNRLSYDIIEISSAREKGGIISIKDDQADHCMGPLANVSYLSATTVALWFDTNPDNKKYIEHFLKYSE